MSPNTTRWLIGVGGGALVGAAVFALAAPRTGREVRARLRELLRPTPTPEEIDAAYAAAEGAARRAMGRFG